jgi:hypothetical protein
MKKEGIRKDLLIASIITVVTVIVWVMIDISLTFQKSSVSNVLVKQTQVLNPKLDIFVLDDLEKKHNFEFNNEEDYSPSVVETNLMTVPETSSLSGISP